MKAEMFTLVKRFLVSRHHCSGPLVWFKGKVEAEKG